MPTTSGANQSITFEIPGEAVPWKRAQRHGKVTFTDPTRKTHMDLIKTIARRAMKDVRLTPLFSPVSLTVRVVRCVPASFSAKHRQAALAGEIWPSTRPDLGNYVKLIEDAMNDEVYDDDSQICWVHASKVYGPLSKTIITVQTL